MKPVRLMWSRRWVRSVGGVVAVGVAASAIAYTVASIPLPKDVEPSPGARVYDRHGKLIGSYSGEVRRSLIDTSKLPEHVGEAVVAAEDSGFYRHFGLSLTGILRAAWRDLTSRSIRQGGSTISQQYAKNALLADPSRTVTRKLREAVLAVKLERRFSKDDILGFYLNTAYWGRGAYGIQAAARTYFAKSARKLTVGESAFLASILPAPEHFQPDERPRVVQRRRDRIVDAMLAEGFIAPSEAEEAKQGRVEFAPGLARRADRQRAAYFLEWLRKELLYPRFGECLYTCGLEIHTTLDLEMQEHAEAAVDAVLGRGAGPEASLVAATPAGKVRAFVGGRNFDSFSAARGFNFASDLPGRHAGSAFKPFALLAALEEGVAPERSFSGSSPASIADPACAGEKGKWRPHNYGNRSYGHMSLNQAMALSVNTIFAQLAAEVGPAKITPVLAKLGFDRRGSDAERSIEAHCALALGSLDVTTVEMARAYASLAGRGAVPEVIPIRFILDRDGACLVSYGQTTGFQCDEVIETPSTRVAPQRSVDLLTRTLARVVLSGTGTAADIGRPAAGKTGTSQNNTDAWFAGYVPQLAAAVWVGYSAEEDDDGKRLVPQMRVCGDNSLCRPVGGTDVTGGSLPARIWGAFMRKVTADMKVAHFPLAKDLFARSADGGDGYVPSPPMRAASPEPDGPKQNPAPPPPPVQEPTPTPAETQRPLPLPSPSRAAASQRRRSAAERSRVSPSMGYPSRLLSWNSRQDDNGSPYLVVMDSSGPCPCGPCFLITGDQLTSCG